MVWYSHWDVVDGDVAYRIIMQNTLPAYLSSSVGDYGFKIALFVGPWYIWPILLCIHGIVISRAGA